MFPIRPIALQLYMLAWSLLFLICYTHPVLTISYADPERCSPICRPDMLIFQIFCTHPLHVLNVSNSTLNIVAQYACLIYCRSEFVGPTLYWLFHISTLSIVDQYACLIYCYSEFVVPTLYWLFHISTLNIVDQLADLMLWYTVLSSTLFKTHPALNVSYSTLTIVLI